VYLNIILLSTPTIADVTKIAHRERVPNGTLPKLGRVLSPLWEGNTVVPEEKTSLEMCILVPSTVLSSCEHVAEGVCLFDRRYTAKELLAKQDLYSRYNRSLVLLDKIIDQDNIVHWLHVVPGVTLCAWTHSVFIVVRDCVLGHKYMELFASYYVIPEYRHILH